MQHGDCLLDLCVAVRQDEFHIYRIAVTDRDCRLKPFEKDVPRAAKGVGTGIELTKILHSLYLIAFPPALPLQTVLL